MKSIKNIIREVSPEAMDTQYYFDDSFINGDCGEESMIYIVPLDSRRYAGFNMDRYNEIKETAEAIQNDFVDIAAGYSNYLDFKDCLNDYGLDYLNESKIEALTAWSKAANTEEPESIAEYIAITTGQPWTIRSVYGYCQGDFVTVIYNADKHEKKSAKIYGEVWLNCCKEFCVIELDENGNEEDAVYGYIIADSEAWNDEDYKKLVSEWACIDPEETQLEMISGYQTIASYRIA